MAQNNKDYENINTEKVEEHFQRYSNEADHILKDTKKTEDILNKAGKMCSRLSGLPFIGEYLKMIPIACSFIKDVISGIYPAPVGTVLALMGAITYFVSPVDAVPDCIPVIGLLDDAAILGKILDMVKEDLEDYMRWRAQKDYCPCNWAYNAETFTDGIVEDEEWL